MTITRTKILCQRRKIDHVFQRKIFLEMARQCRLPRRARLTNLTHE